MWNNFSPKILCIFETINNRDRTQRHTSFSPQKSALNIFLSLCNHGRHEQRERVHERRALASEVSKETTARTGIIIIVVIIITRVFVFVVLLYCFCS